MAIHMVTQIGGEDFRITLSRDDAGNYVAEASRVRKVAGASSGTSPLRFVDAVKERALTSLLDSLQHVAATRQSDPSPDGPAPAAA